MVAVVVSWRRSKASMRFGGFEDIETTIEKKHKHTNNCPKRSHLNMI